MPDPTRSDPATWDPATSGPATSGPATSDPATGPRVWVADLGAEGPRREDALADLSALLVRVASAEVGRRAPRTSLSGPELEGLARGAAEDALAAVTADLERFDGRSRFTTWACAFVIAGVSSRLGRCWATQHSAAPTGAGWGRLAERLGAVPAAEADEPDLVSALREAVETVLTPAERWAFTAVLVDGIPMDAVAAQTRSSRAAVYWTLYEARRKVRAHLSATAQHGPPLPRRHPDRATTHDPRDEQQDQRRDA